MENFLLYIKENFSNFLLERLINLQDKNVRKLLESRVTMFSFCL